MSVEKLPEGAGYKVRWRDSAGKSRRKTVRLWRDAVALDGEMKRKKAMGELIAHEKGKQTVAEFWEVWWPGYAQVYVTPRTQIGYEIAWRKYLKPYFGSVPLRALERQQVVDFVAKSSKAGLSGSTIRKHITVLQNMLSRAMEWGYITSNPAAGVKKPPLQSRRGIALNDEQLAALCAELDQRSAAIVRVLAETGLRPGELRALRWRDLRDGFVVVEYAVSQNQFGETKNRKRRTVELRPAARKTLVEWKLSRGPQGPDDLVFPSASGSGVWTDSGYNIWAKRTFGDAAGRAGLKGTVVYDLRHTFVSKLIKENERDIYWIARQAGHSPEVALTTYAHFFEEVRGESVPSACPSEAESLESSSPLGDSNP